MRSALAAILCTLSIPAAADTFQATLEGPLVEVSHEVEVTLSGGVALYQVRRVFANPGKQADEATVEITLPYGAAATGLRIRARDRWYDADFLPAAEAERRYLELTGLGKYQPKDPALLAWIWPGELLLRVFPVFPGGASTVEYTLVAPTRYDRGRYFVSYPRAGEGKLAPPILRVKPAWGDALLPIRVDGQRLPPDAPVVLSAPAVGDRPAFLPEGAGFAVSSLVVPPEADGPIAKLARTGTRR
jgi:hypothetical protein